MKFHRCQYTGQKKFLVYQVFSSTRDIHRCLSIKFALLKCCSWSVLLRGSDQTLKIIEVSSISQIVKMTGTLNIGATYNYSIYSMYETKQAVIFRFPHFGNIEHFFGFDVTLIL